MSTATEATALLSEVEKVSAVILPEPMAEVVPLAELDAAVDRLVQALLACGPQAQLAAKELIAALAGRPIDDAVAEETAVRIARQRATAEAREGFAAFFDKRPPAWMA